MAIAALIIGIIALLSSALPFAGAVLGLVAIILGIVGRKKLVAEGRKTGAPIAGIVLGAISLAGNTAMTVACMACGAAVANAEPADVNAGLLDTAAAIAPAAGAAPAAPAAAARVFRCDLSAQPARQCSEYRLGSGTTEASAQSSCNLVQIVTPEAQRVPLVEGTCPTDNAVARCEPRFGTTTHVYYRDTSPGIDQNAALAATETLCTGTFTRL